jgi:hypothetical protein
VGWQTDTDTLVSKSTFDIVGTKLSAEFRHLFRVAFRQFEVHEPGNVEF